MRTGSRMGNPYGEQPGWGQGGWRPQPQPQEQRWPAPPVTDWARPPVQQPPWVPPVQPPPVWQPAPPKASRRGLWWGLGAAALALVVAAGGKVTDGRGGALRFGQSREGFLVPEFIAWGDPSAAI